MLFSPILVSVDKYILRKKLEFCADPWAEMKSCIFPVMVYHMYASIW